MNYIKSLAKSVYENVVQDEYLEMLTEQQIYFIINTTHRKRLFSHGQDNSKLNESQTNQSLMQKAQLMGNVSPQRQFRVFGVDTNYGRVVQRHNELNQILGEVTKLMMDNFGVYKTNMELAIKQIDGIKSLYSTKKLAIQLKDKLQLLQEQSMKSRKIANLNIRIKNLESVLKILVSVPNIKKMSVGELKNISPQQIMQKSILNRLVCLSRIGLFIESAVSSQLNNVLMVIEQCLINRFEQVLYQNALKDFIIAQNKSIKYSNLLKKLLQKQLHKMGTFSTFLESCKFIIRLLENVHSIFRWHRNHQEQQYWQQLSIKDYQISIQISAKGLTDIIMAEIDEAIKEQVLHRFYQYQNSGESATRILQDFYLLMRIARISTLFSGGSLTQSLNEITQHMLRRLLAMKQKSKLQMNEIFRNEQRNNWNRLPVVDDYSPDGVDRGLYQIQGHRNLSYDKVIKALKEVKGMLKDVKLNSSLGGDLWESEWMRSKGCETEEKQSQQDAQSWQIESIEFPFIQKYEKNKRLIKAKAKIQAKDDVHKQSPESPASYDKQVSQIQAHSQTIICQYCLNILKHLLSFVSFCFYFPLQPVISQSIKIAEQFIQNYIYQVFNCFMSTSLRDMFMCQVNHKEGVSLEWKYHKKRLHVQYPNVTHFIRLFEKTHKISFKKSIHPTNQIPSPTKSQRQSLSSSQQLIPSEAIQNMEVRSRVVALQSLAYLIKHYENILNVAGFLSSDSSSIGCLHPNLSCYLQKRISTYNTVYKQLSELIYTDNISRLCNLKTTSSFVESIKWNDVDLQIGEYVQIFAQKCKDFYYKMVSSNRGQVPLGICEKLFGLFWKTQITTIMKTFMVSFKAQKNIYSVQNSGKNKFERFIDMLYDNIGCLIEQKGYISYPYERIKSGFAILMQSNFSRAFQVLKQSLLKFEFIYSIQINLLLTSESCCYLSQNDIEENKKIFQHFVQQIVQ